MSDRIIAAAALLALATFLAVFVVRVREIDLLIVLGGVFLLAAIDFGLTLFGGRRR